jgi:hypothetical protein
MEFSFPIKVIHCAYWAIKHIRIVREISSIEVLLAVVPRLERLDYIQSEYCGINALLDLDTALASDAVEVMVDIPISTHFSLAPAALEAGKHVVDDKPLGMTNSECRKLIATAEEGSRFLSVGHTHGMAPMACNCIARAGGKFRSSMAQKGRAWLQASEPNVSMTDNERGVTWRSDERPEPVLSRLMRHTRAITSCPSSSTFEPTLRLNHEMRPNERGRPVYSTTLEKRPPLVRETS